MSQDITLLGFHLDSFSCSVTAPEKTDPGACLSPSGHAAPRVFLSQFQLLTGRQAETVFCSQSQKNQKEVPKTKNPKSTRKRKSPTPNTPVRMRTKPQGLRDLAAAFKLLCLLGCRVRNSRWIRPLSFLINCWAPHNPSASYASRDFGGLVAKSEPREWSGRGCRQSPRFRTVIVRPLSAPGLLCYL